MEWFNFGSFNIISVTKLVLKDPAIVDHLFFSSLRIFWRSYNTSLRTIDALAPLSNKILIVSTLEFRFSSEVPGLFWEFVEISPRSFGGKITPKVMGDKSVAFIDYLLFEFHKLLGWLTRRDLIDTKTSIEANGSLSNFCNFLSSTWRLDQTIAHTIWIIFLFEFTENIFLIMNR